MAKSDGSAITTAWLEGAERICVKCGAEIKNMDRDVGVVRSRYPGPVREIICTECFVNRHTGRTTHDQGTKSS